VRRKRGFCFNGEEEDHEENYLTRSDLERHPVARYSTILFSAVADKNTVSDPE